MGNMSYCRFQNTVPDLRECQDALSEIADLDQLGKEEAAAARHLINMCRRIAEDWDVDA